MSEIESLEDLDASTSPARTDTKTRQKSSAAVQTIDPAAVLAKISGRMTQTTADIIQLISQGCQWTADIIGLEIRDHPVQLSQWLSQRRLTSAGDCCPMYLMISWALDWSRDFRSAIQLSVRPLDLCYKTLLHIISYYYIHHYYVLLRSVFLHCFYIVFYAILHSLLLRIITKSLLRIITSLLLHHYNITTFLQYY